MKLLRWFECIAFAASALTRFSLHRVDLAQWGFEAFRISISKETLCRAPQRMGFRKLARLPLGPQARSALKEKLTLTRQTSLFATQPIRKPC